MQGLQKAAAASAALLRRPRASSGAPPHTHAAPPRDHASISPSRPHPTQPPSLSRTSGQGPFKPKPSRRIQEKKGDEAEQPLRSPDQGYPEPSAADTALSLNCAPPGHVSPQPASFIRPTLSPWSIPSAPLDLPTTHPMQLQPWSEKESSSPLPGLNQSTAASPETPSQVSARTPERARATPPTSTSQHPYVPASSESPASVPIAGGQRVQQQQGALDSRALDRWASGGWGVHEAAAAPLSTHPHQALTQRKSYSDARAFAHPSSPSPMRAPARPISPGPTLGLSLTHWTPLIVQGQAPLLSGELYICDFT